MKRNQRILIMSLMMTILLSPIMSWAAITNMAFKPLAFSSSSKYGVVVEVIAQNNLIAQDNQSLEQLALEVDEEISEYTGPLQLIGKAYNYPNPFSYSKGQTTIGFRTNKDGETLTLDIYSLRGNKIYSQSIESHARYVKEVLTKEKMGISNLEPGVYMFTISHNGELLAQNRMVVVP